MLSKSTTRKRMLSKSLCHVQNHAFGLVPANRYFHVFITSNFHSQTLESLCLQASYYDYWLTPDINTTVSTCIPKYHRPPDSYINITVAFGNGDGMIPLDNLGAFSNRLPLTNIASKAEVYKPKPKTTYNMIKDYVLNKYSFNVHTAYIAEVKRSLGLPMLDAPNAVETLKSPRKHPTPIQVVAIKVALSHFEVI